MVPDLLKRAGRHQKAVEDGLTNLLDLLGVWGGAGEIRGEARVLRDLVAPAAPTTPISSSERVSAGASRRRTRPTASGADLDAPPRGPSRSAEQAGVAHRPRRAATRPRRTSRRPRRRPVPPRRTTRRRWPRRREKAGPLRRRAEKSALNAEAAALAEPRRTNCGAAAAQGEGRGRRRSAGASREPAGRPCRTNSARPPTPSADNSQAEGAS